jgi:hypothetical protein
MNISKKFLYTQFFGVTLYILQFIPYISIAMSISISISIIYFFHKSKLEYSLFFILLFSVLSTSGTNIYTFKIMGINLFYITLLILFISLIYKNKKELTKIPKLLFFYMFLILVVLIYSISNLFESVLFFTKDLIIIIIIPTLIVILFRKTNSQMIVDTFINIMSIKILASLLMYAMGLTLVQDENMFDVLSIDNGDELGSLFVVILLSLVFIKRISSDKWVFILFFITLFGLFQYGLGFAGLGSQVMMMILIVLVYFGLKKKIFFIPSLLIFLLILNIDKTGNEAIDYKIQNITELFSNLNQDDIYLIPHSPQVRVIELINIASYPWYNILFGHGIGGYFTDSHLEFNQYIGKYDFSEYEIDTRKFYNPHNLAYNFLKFGLLWQIFLVYLLYKAIRQTSGDIRMFLVLSLFTLSLNMGYAIKTSILFGILLIMLHNSNQRKVVAKTN